MSASQLSIHHNYSTTNFDPSKNTPSRYDTIYKYITDVTHSVPDVQTSGLTCDFDSMAINNTEELLPPFDFTTLNPYLNSTENDSFIHKCSDTGPPWALLVSQQVLYALVCIVGLLGNTLVIYVVIRFSKMQTVTNMYIVNLAIADECFLIGIPFLIVTMNRQQWIFGNAACKAYMISTSINQFTSSIFLFIMSADRYIAVCHPINSPRWRTPFISRLVSLLAWTASAIFIIPVVLYANAFPIAEPFSNFTDISTISAIPEEVPVTCNIAWTTQDQTNSGQRLFTIYSFILGFAVPLLLIFVFYCFVIRKLKTVGPKNRSKEKRRSHRKVTKLVLTVITVYVLCWLPYWIAQVALISTPPENCQSPIIITVYLLASCLSYSNSAMNPILYAFLSDNFKKSFVKACTCAAGKDVNATLHMENSVFPRRRHGTNTGGGQGGKQGGSASPAAFPAAGSAIPFVPEDDEEAGPLVSRADPSTSAITMTSRSNITLSTVTAAPSDTGSSGKESNQMTTAKNGALLVPQPTDL